jgi:UDP-glucose 4-epimerase
MRILVTGASGYLGSALVNELARSPWVEKIVGLDIKASQWNHEKFLFIKRDIREPLSSIINEHRLDTIAHLSYVLPPIHDKKRMESINVGGTRNVLRAATETGIGHILYTSSTTAYGFHPDNEVPLTEESPLRGNPEFTYSKNKKEIELEFERFTQSQDHTRVTILRPCFVVGPGFDNPLARHLSKRFVILPAGGRELQFVHESDLINISLICLKERIHGVYNVTGEGTMSFKEMVSELGGVMVEIPRPVIYPLNNMAWKLRLSFVTEFPSAAMQLMIHPWIATSEKLKQRTGYVFKYDTRSAFRDFALSRKKRAGVS